MKSFIACIVLVVTSLNTYAESTRIEVTPQRQAFVDVVAGDTLSEITDRLLPDHPSQQQRLMKEIVALNPDAFINNNPNQLKAHVRLWLPGHMSGLHKTLNSQKFRIRKFSWGYIQQPR